MNLNTMKDTLVLKTAQGRLVVAKNAPEILMTAGIVGVIAGGVLACRATLKAKKVWDEASELVEAIKSAGDVEDPAAKEEAVRAVIIVGASAGAQMAKLYAPAVIVSGLGIAALLRSRNILTARNAGLIAALKLTNEAYMRYRDEVVSGLGEDVDSYIRSGQDKTGNYFVSEEDDKGKLKKVKFSPEEGSFPFGVSQYAKYFDDSSPQWRQHAEANVFFLKSQQTNMNITLATQGHLFLNEVYDALGLPRTSAGAVVGWVKGHGDDLVDFGLFNGFNTDAINGYVTNEFLLDFNVDGVIYDLI